MRVEDALALVAAVGAVIGAVSDTTSVVPPDVDVLARYWPQLATLAVVGVAWGDLRRGQREQEEALRRLYDLPERVARVETELRLMREEDG